MITELIIGGASYLFSKGITKKIIENKEKNNELSKNMDLLINSLKDEEYDEAIDIADEMIEEYEDEEDAEEIVKFCKFVKVESYVGKGMDLKDENDDISIWDEGNEEALNSYKTAHSLLCQYGSEYGYDENVCWELQWVNLFLENNLKARNFCINLLTSSNENIRQKAYEHYNRLTCDVLEDDDFTENVDYEQRKYIFIGRNEQQISGTFLIDDSKRLVDWIFTLDKLPSDIEFPLGRPQPGLYMAHPVKTEQYFPMKNAEETLFMEKVREFCWLVQCLGAKEVSFHSIKGISVSEGYGSSMNIEANVEVKGVNLGGGYGNSSRYDESRGFHQQVERVQHFDPKKKAYCPDDLVWLDSDPAWKDLIKQRLNGNMLDYTYKISSSETCQMSTNEKDEVKANFEYMMVKVNGSYNSEKDTTFSSSKETEWSIHVEFAPLNELTEENTNTIKRTDTMETKFNEVPELTDDVILKMNGGGNPSERTEKERLEFAKRLHDKFSMPIEGVYQWKGKAVLTGQVSSGILEVSKDPRIVIIDAQGNAQSATVEGVGMFNKILDEAESGDNCGLIINGIQPEDVKIGSIVYLQSQFLPSVQNGTCFSDQEQEYLNEVKETIEDYDEIGPKERKRLEKTRIRLGISESRAAEIEASVSQSQLTDEEKEYLNEVQEVREDYGEIGPKERKYLEKTRIRLDISVERANELERM